MCHCSRLSGVDFSWKLLALHCCVLWALLESTVFAEEASFFRGVNLNGPAIVIDGHPWQAGDTPDVSAGDAGFEDQNVRLVPATDDAHAKMIRSSRWSPSGKARIQITNVPAGTYSIFLYVWEDNLSQTFDIQLGGRIVADKYRSGEPGHWDRLGPWVAEVTEGTIELTAEGGHANLSGLEIWRGKVSSQKHSTVAAAPPSVPATLESRAAVVLARHCLECHNASDHKGGLDLTRRDSALKGGDSGAVLIPGDVSKSLMLHRVTEAEMPPKGRAALTADEIAVVREWIAAGAKWATDPIDPFLYTTDRRAGYNWWSLQPIRAVEPPQVSNTSWPRNSLDQFILQRLQAAGLQPSPEADRQTLIRRLSFDLLGLPPSPESVEAFVADADPQAYEHLVDRLLNSPHYGEHWARHWLDIVRFGESQGFERNKLRESAWKYRDFVVEAFNSDLPYDNFIRWQIAGDVLHADDPLAVAASGFLVMGPYDLTAYTTGTADMRAFAREEELEGLVGTVCQTFMGLTVNCGRCHDHKFDPITQKEFYQVSAALGGTLQGDEREIIPIEARPAAQKRITQLNIEIEKLNAEEKTATIERKLELASQRSRLESVQRLLKAGPVHTTRPNEPGEWHVLARGDFRQPGEVVAPRGIAAIAGISSDWQLPANAPEAERRKALANWIADPQNPLTPRVIVNRLWGYHFGDGLVRTPNDFGFQGGLPSHPELLDWLAHELVHPADGPAWSLKRIQRIILLSATYRQSSRANEKCLKLDADNRLVWRRSSQRLEAETFRDTLLAVAGYIELRIGGPGYRDFKISSAGNNETYTVFEAFGPEFNRRSLYRTSVRAGTSPLLDVLDCPDPSVATPRRSVTSTPLQALSLLNNTFIEKSAGRFVARLEREAPNDTTAQVRRAYALAFARKPDQQEEEAGKKFIAAHGLQQFCIVVFNANEFLYID